MSLVCVDELKLLADIEKLLKREIRQVMYEGYEPDPNIKPEPIQNGRNSQRSGKPGGKNKPRNSARRHGSKGGSAPRGNARAGNRNSRGGKQQQRSAQQ